MGNCCSEQNSETIREEKIAEVESNRLGHKKVTYINNSMDNGNQDDDDSYDSIEEHTYRNTGTGGTELKAKKVKSLRLNIKKEDENQGNSEI